MGGGSVGHWRLMRGGAVGDIYISTHHKIEPTDKLACRYEDLEFILHAEKLNDTLSKFKSSGTNPEASTFSFSNKN